MQYLLRLIFVVLGWSAGQAWAAEKHLIYMQGCCVQKANGAAARDYQTIVQTLRDAGFNVFF